MSYGVEDAIPLYCLDFFLTAVVLIFKFQNLTFVTISLLGMSATLPVSTLVILVYLLGMVTGSALFGLVRSWIHGATQPPR